MLERELIKDFNKYINKKLQPLKKAIQGKELRIFTILTVLQWVIIFFLWSTKAEDSHSHGWYAEDNHSHGGYAEDGHSHDSDDKTYNWTMITPQLLWESQQKQFQTYDEDENHTHSAKDIEYGIWTLDSKIREIDNEISFLR